MSASAGEFSGTSKEQRSKKMKRRVLGVMLSVMIVIAAVFSGITNVYAAENTKEPVSFTRIESSEINLPLKWVISISGTKINTELTDMNAVDGIKTVLTVNKGNSDVLADLKYISNT